MNSGPIKLEHGKRYVNVFKMPLPDDPAIHCAICTDFERHSLDSERHPFCVAFESEDTFVRGCSFLIETYGKNWDLLESKEKEDVR